MLRDLKAQNLLLAVGALAIASFVLPLVVERMDDPLYAHIPYLALAMILVAVWLLHSRNYLVAAWILVIGCLGVILLLVVWSRITIAASLLALPVGVATVVISVPAGVLVAAACSSLLLFLPVGITFPYPGLGLVVILGMWGTVFIVWMTLRSLLTALDWSWSSYEQARSLLEEARDARVQLKEALADLADANLQLSRLNQMAQGLRHAAEEARNTKEQFVANVSHELRTPLNMIIGFSEVIMRNPETYGSNLPSALLADLAIIHRNSQHLSSLIDDVLDLSQIETGRVALVRERVALGEIVNAAALAMRPLFESKRLALQIEIPEDLPVILCDRTRIREVVLNLLSNAGRFTDSGKVCVRAWQEQNDIVVSVSDTGPGIAPADKERLFRPFEQLDGSIRRRFGGTGLGLSISKGFVELHGGRMWVESQEGVGTTFFFSLPLDLPGSGETGVSRWLTADWEYRQRSRDQRSRHSLIPLTSNSPRLVIWERGRSMQRILHRYMVGAEITAVNSLEEAGQELAREPAQALLANAATVHDPLRCIQESNLLPGGVPVIICAIPDTQQAAEAIGAADYLIKPISQEELFGVLDRLAPRGGTVLVVDDEPEAARLYMRMFAASGRRYHVLRATDGQQALIMLREYRPDVVLLDLVMPDMDGFRVLAVASQDPDLKDIPIVIISARDPAGQPIVTNALSVTRADGISMAQLLDCIDSLCRILSVVKPSGDPKWQVAPAD